MSTIQKIQRLALVVIVIFTIEMMTSSLASAQAADECDSNSGSGTTCITFAGEPLSGPSEQMTAFVLEKLRPTVAQAEPEGIFVSPGEVNSFVPRANCFGVTERKANGLYLLRETKYRTDFLTNGRYNAVVPSSETDHGDWPPHLPLFKISTDQPYSCGLLVADISWRLMYKPQRPGTLVFTFELNPEHMDEYKVMASDGGLGFFVASPTPTVMTVNGETFESQACFDCMAHTAAVTTTVGAGVYSPATVQWFGEVTENAPTLTSMYVLPVPRTAGVQHSVTIQLDAQAFENGQLPIIVMWYGRFDVPGYNVPRTR